MASAKRANRSRRNAEPGELSRRSEPTREIIARRAYYIWQNRGCPDGTAAEDWRQAEMEMRQDNVFRTGRRETPRQARPTSCDSILDEASDESFPASDPPAWTDCTCT